MQSRVVVLGLDRVNLDRPVPREGPEDRLDALESLLSGSPDAVLVAAQGEDAFFRASLALERGVRKVVIRRGSMEQGVVKELATRARSFGAEVFVHSAESGRYERVSPPRNAPAIEVGAPDLEAWSRALAECRDDQDRVEELGLRVSEQEREAAKDAADLPSDQPVAGVPQHPEEAAFAAGLKPVLYLVVPADELEAVRQRHPRAHVETIETAIHEDVSTGARHYGAGPSAVHAFLAENPELAKAAAHLWADGSSRHIVEIGRLMGYPGCCVTAYATLRSRANNAALVYVTAARTRALRGTFHPLLGGNVVHLVPFTPCTYGCSRAISWAERLLATFPAQAQPRVRRAMERPVLYLDHTRAVVFDGVSKLTREAVTFERAYLVPGHGGRALHAGRLFGWLLAGGGTLRVGPEALEMESGAGALRRLRRGIPALGVLLPFAAS